MKRLLAGELVDHSGLGYGLGGHHLALMAKGEGVHEAMSAVARRLDRRLLAVRREEEPFSATGPITLFNGGVQGGTTLLLIHTYVDVPAPTAVIATVKITKVRRGHFGLDAVAAIPRIAGGSGSVTAVKITMGRASPTTARRSYLTASCPTGTYYTEGEVEFSDATKLHITHALPCTPTG